MNDKPINSYTAILIARRFAAFWSGQNRVRQHSDSCSFSATLAINFFTEMPHHQSIAISSISGLLLPLSLAVLDCHAATFPVDAKTQDGSTVILYEDGTWRPKTLQLDHSIIRRGQFANQLHKSRFGFYEFWVDPKAWHPEEASGAFEFNFAHTDGEAWCGIIPERIQLTEEALRNAVLKNAKSSDPNASLIQRSKAFVNGLAGEALEVSATMEGYYVTYYMFLWSGSKGTAQIVCWSASSIIDEYRPVFNDFFGGFLLSQ